MAGASATTQPQPDPGWSEEMVPDRRRFFQPWLVSAGKSTSIYLQVPPQISLASSGSGSRIGASGFSGGSGGSLTGGGEGSEGERNLMDARPSPPFVKSPGDQGRLPSRSNCKGPPRAAVCSHSSMNQGRDRRSSLQTLPRFYRATKHKGIGETA